MFVGTEEILHVGIIPTTFTVAVFVEVFPLISLTVKVTLLAPMFPQPNVFGETLIEAIPQLSEEPLSTSVGTTEADPLAKVTV